PRYGIEGAALATSAASIIYNGMLFLTVYRFYKLQPFDKKNLRILAIVIIIFLVFYFLPHIAIPWIDIAVRTSAISLIYFVLAYSLKIVPEFHRYLPWEKSK